MEKSAKIHFDFSALGHKWYETLDFPGKPDRLAVKKGSLPEQELSCLRPTALCIRNYLNN